MKQTYIGKPIKNSKNNSNMQKIQAVPLKMLMLKSPHLFG